MMPIKYYSSGTAVFILQIICSGKISSTASTTDSTQETTDSHILSTDPTTLISNPPASYSSNSSTTLTTVPTSHTYLSLTELIENEEYTTLDLLSTQKKNLNDTLYKSDTTISISKKIMDILRDSSSTNTLLSDAVTDIRSTFKIDGKILKTNSVNDAYTEFGTLTSAAVFTDTSSVSGSKTRSTKEIITDAVHINKKASMNPDTHFSTTSKQIITSTSEQTDDTPVSIGDHTNVLDNELSTTKTEMVTPEKNSTLSAATTDSVTIILEKITPQTTISMDMVSTKTEKITTQTDTPIYAFKTTADKTKPQTAQDNKTTSIRQIGTTIDTDKKIDKQTTTEIVYITNSETKQATTQLVSTVNDVSVTFVDITAHAATSSDPKKSKAVQTTTQAATTKSTTEKSTTKASITPKVLSTTAEKSTTQTYPVLITTRDASKTDEQSNTTKQSTSEVISHVLSTAPAEITTHVAFMIDIVNQTAEQTTAHTANKTNIAKTTKRLPTTQTAATTNSVLTSTVQTTTHDTETTNHVTSPLLPNTMLVANTKETTRKEQTKIEGANYTSARSATVEQITTQAANSNNTVSAKERQFFTTILQVISHAEQTATNASTTAEAVTTTLDASKIAAEQSTTHDTTTLTGIIATITKLTTTQTTTSGLVTTKAEKTTSTTHDVVTTKMETLDDSKKSTSKQGTKQTISSIDANKTIANKTTTAEQSASQTSTTMDTVVPFETTTYKVLSTDNSSIEYRSMANRTVSASEIITSTMKESNFEAEAKTTAKSDGEQTTTNKTEPNSTITFKAKSSEQRTLQEYPTATKADVTLSFESPITLFITTKTYDGATERLCKKKQRRFFSRLLGDITSEYTHSETFCFSTYSPTADYQLESASERTKNELQSISSLMSTTEDASSSAGHSAKTHTQSQNYPLTETETILISTESTTSKTILSTEQDTTTQTKTTSAPERTWFETNQESTITAEQTNNISTLSKAKSDITSTLIQTTIGTTSDEQYGRSFLNQTSTSERQSISTSLFQTTISTNVKSDSTISEKQSISSETVRQTNDNNTSDTLAYSTAFIDQTSDGTSSLQPDSSSHFSKTRVTKIFKSQSDRFTTMDPTSDSSISESQSNGTQIFRLASVGITSQLQLDTTKTINEADDTMKTLTQSGSSTTIGQMSVGTSSSAENDSVPSMIETSDRTLSQTQYDSKSTMIQTEGTTALFQINGSTPPEVQSPVSTKKTQTTDHSNNSSPKFQSSNVITIGKTSDSTLSQTIYDSKSTMIQTEGTTTVLQIRGSTPPEVTSSGSTLETQTTDSGSQKSQSSNAMTISKISDSTLQQAQFESKPTMIQTEGITTLLQINESTPPEFTSTGSTLETQTTDSGSQKSQSSNALTISKISDSTLPQAQYDSKPTMIQTEGTTTLLQINGSTPSEVTYTGSTLETQTTDSGSQNSQSSNAITISKISDSTLPQAHYDSKSTINQTEGTTTLLQISGGTQTEVTSIGSTLETQTTNSTPSTEVSYTADSTTLKTQYMGTSLLTYTTKQATQSNVTVKAVSTMETIYGSTISVQQTTDRRTSGTHTVGTTPVPQSNGSVSSGIQYGKSTTIFRSADNTAQSESITAIDHTTENFISLSQSQSNTHGNKRDDTTTIGTSNYSTPSLTSLFEGTTTANRTPDIPFKAVTTVLQTSSRTKSQPEMDITTVLNTENKVSDTKYAENTTETPTTENMASATLSNGQNTSQTITQSQKNMITEMQKNPLHGKTTIQNQAETTTYSHDVTTEFLYSPTTQKADSCHSVPCDDDGICISLSSIDFVCQCNSSKCGTYAENPCDNTENPPCVSDGVVHTCLLMTDGTFTCVCQNGYTNEGVYCIDIDECRIPNNDCKDTTTQNFKAGVVACQNLPGNYSCLCDTKYYTDNCEDIDECLADTDNCDDATRALCTNINGGFSCTCKQGYRGDGITCTQDRFTIDTSKSLKIMAEYSEYTFLNNGIPAGTEVYPSFYVSKNGLILLTTVTYDKMQTGIQKPFSNPSTLSLNSDFQEKVAVAGWWAQMKTENMTDSSRGLSCKLTEISNVDTISVSEEVHKMFNDTSFNGSTMVTCTWNKMGYSANDRQTVTFQVSLITDYNNTYAVVTYQDRAMSWNIPIFSQANYPVRIGYAVQTNEGVTTNEYPYSFLNLMASHVGMTKPLIEKIDAVSGESLQLSGKEWNSLGIGMPSEGKLGFRLTNNGNSFEHHGILCRDWINNDQADVVNQIKANDAATCPCVNSQMIKEFYAEIVSDRIPTDYTCYMSAKAVSGLDPRSKRCCYDSKGQLITDHVEVNGMNTYQRYSPGSQDEDNKMYDSCCKSIYSHYVKTSLCSQFLARRPVSSCDLFQSSSVAAAVGDPHVVTLDGLAFTFNGHGEFVLLKSSSFELQGRTVPIVRDNVTQNATIFSAIAAQQFSPLSEKVEIRLNANKDDIEFVHNGSVVTHHFNTSSAVYTGVTVCKETTGSNKTVYKMTFSVGLVVAVSVSFGMIEPVVSASASLKNTFTGLFGNFNDNIDDEYTGPDGVTLSKGAAATEDEVYFYGIKWQNNETNSLFSYDNDDSWNKYIDTSFIPVFFNANLTVMFPNDTDRQNAQDACYKRNDTDPHPAQRRQCYFDYKATGNALLAQETANANNNVKNIQTVLANFPPLIQNRNTSVEVIEGNSYSNIIYINAVDQNGDNIYFLLNNDAPSGLGIDNVTGGVFWYNVSDLTAAQLVITASDGTASSVWSPLIKYCNCKNGGTCDFNIKTTESFIVVPCICQNGYEGDFCQTDIDACASGPCHPEVICTDVPAHQQDTKPFPFKCDACPPGLIGDGRTCADHDECSEDPPPCQHSCENLAAGYLCSCNQGYSIASDSKACIDTDECTTGTAICDSSTTSCNNTDGGYNCDCLTGFYRAGDLLSCQDVDECSTGPCPLNSVCRNTVGSYTCVCIYGYQWNAQALTCNDRDECSPMNNCDQACIDGIGLYTCTCRSGFKLSIDTVSCIPENECTAAQKIQCDGGSSRSTCATESTNSTYIICQCLKGYAMNSSNYCVDIDECASGPTKCPVTSDCENTEGDFYCRCHVGYRSGIANKTCFDINECTDNSNDCSMGCVNTEGSYYCTCQQGYRLNNDGVTCINIDDCAQSTTNFCDKEFGICTDTTPGYTCSCQNGYTGDGFTCSDLNECSQTDRGNCTQGCLNNIGSFICFCGNGYTLENDGKTCKNIDECARDIDNNCYDSTLCTDTDGSYACNCPPDFELKADGRSCQSLHKCEPNNGCSDTCNRINGTDTCACPSGYELDYSEIICRDIDECSNSSLNNCNAQNNVNCENLNGSYVCNCINSSYTSIEQYKCVDIDECLLAIGTCPAKSRCINQDPGYNCLCLSGYILSQSICDDVNECLLGTDSCHPSLAQCTNTEGGYTCSCLVGYQGDGIICSDIDECSLGTNNCDKQIGRGACNNTVGSYTCGCYAGFSMASNERTCKDIDECLRSHNCQDGCENLPGTYKCTCQNGYHLASDQKSCKVDIACNPSTNCQYQCAKIDGIDTCTCQAGYQLMNDNINCSDKDECSADNSTCDVIYGVCNNTVGSYICSCSDGFVLGPGNTCTDRDGKWSDWESWSACTLTCGAGLQTRTRACSNPSQAGSGENCLGDGSGTQTCNNVLCPATSDEQLYGVTVYLEGLTRDQLNSVETPFKQLVADIVNTYCNYNASNVQQCCQTSTSYSSNPSNPLTFTTSNNIVFGSGTPLEINNLLAVMIVIKYESNNALCTAALASVGRRRRSVILSELELALPQDIFKQIIANPDLQATITQSLVNTIDTLLGVSLNITVSAVTLVTTTTTASSSTQGIVKSNDTEPWVIGVAVVGALLSLILIILGLALLFRLKMKTKVAPLEEGNREEEDINE